MNTVAAATPVTPQLPAHASAQLPAVDGQTISYRTTEPAHAPKAVVVYVNGTLGTPDMFDMMGEQLARSDVKSYAMGSRTGAEWLSKAPGVKLDISRYADDVQRVVDVAAREHPGVPISVIGTSLGGTIVESWNIHRNPDRLPVLATSPVTWDRFLPLGQKATVIGSVLGGEQAARTLTDTPMSRGAQMTTNPASRYLDPSMRELKVPAGLWRDDFLMNLDIGLRHADARGPLTVVLAGDDQVNSNFVARLFSRLIGASPTTIPGAAHDLSQETGNPAVVDAIRGFALRSHQPAPDEPAAR